MSKYRQSLPAPVATSHMAASAPPVLTLDKHSAILPLKLLCIKSIIKTIESEFVLPQHVPVAPKTAAEVRGRFFEYDARYELPNLYCSWI